VGLGGFELPTSPLSGVRSNQLSYRPAGLLLQNKGYKFSPVALIWFCSTVPAIDFVKNISNLSKLDRRKNKNRAPRSGSCDFRATPRGASCRGSFRKEVIQPQVLLQLPCYDFTPITNHTVVTCLPYGLAQPLLVQPAFVM
jgi:hypothetical protein